MSGKRNIKTSNLKLIKSNTKPCFLMRILQSVSVHSSGKVQLSKAHDQLEKHEWHTRLYRLVYHFFGLLTHFVVVCDLLLSRHTATRNLFVEYINIYIYIYFKNSHRGRVSFGELLLLLLRPWWNRQTTPISTAMGSAVATCQNMASFKHRREYFFFCTTYFP